MPKTKIAEYSQTPIGNEDVGNIGITGEAPVSNIDDALQTIMAHLADMNAGASPLDDTFTLTSTVTGQGNVRFDASQVGNSTTQVLTVPNASGSLVIADEDGALVVKNALGVDVDVNAKLLNGQSDSHYLAATNLTGTILDANLPETISDTRLPNTISSDITGNAASATNATDHIADTNNPHGVTKADLGLASAENTTDLAKPISTTTQTALDEKLSLSGGTMIGNIDMNGHQVVGIDVLPVGFEAPWQNMTAPVGWFIQNGDTFDAATYPLLAAHLGGNTLPDMRGVVPRGLDSGRGLDADAARVLGSYQDDDFASHKHLQGAEIQGNIAIFGTESRADTGNGYLDHENGNTNIYPYTSSVGGDETRMKNIAKIWLIKHD